MSKIIAVVFLIILCAGSAHARSVDECGRKPDPQVTINVVFEEPHYDFSKNLGGIQQLANDHSHSSIPHYHTTTMGITRYSPIIEFEVPLVVEKTGNKPACAHIDHINVSVGYRDVTVFVARDVPENSCGRKETIAHEQKHIAANREILDKFVPLIRERFDIYARLNGTFQTSNADEAEKVVQARLRSIIDNIMSRMQAENMRRQREVDSREEYYRLAQACDGELSKIASQYREQKPH